MALNPRHHSNVRRIRPENRTPNPTISPEELHFSVSGLWTISRKPALYLILAGRIISAGPLKHAKPHSVV
jgi:hypothetical protein